MLKYEIKKPVWNTQSVGISSHRLVEGTSMEITISYRDSDGQLVYPYRYQMACRKIKTYPIQVVSAGIKLHIVPIADFEALEAVE